MHTITDERLRGRLILGLLCGIAAPLLYLATVAWGATLIPGYSHLTDAISSLMEAGQGGTEVVPLLFGVYNALVIGFAMTGLTAKRRPDEWTISFGLLYVTGLIGILMWPFPMDPVGAPMTPAGIAHIVLAGLLSLASMGTIGASALAWRKAPNGMGMTTFSALCLLVVFTSGLLAAAAAAGGWTLMGLLERVTIGTFQVWQFGTATVLLAGLALRGSGTRAAST